MADRSWPESSRHLGSQGRPCANAGPFTMTAAHSAMVPPATTQRQRHSTPGCDRPALRARSTPGLTLTAKQGRPCHRAWPTPMASHRVLPTFARRRSSRWSPSCRSRRNRWRPHAHLDAEASERRLRRLIHRGIEVPTPNRHEQGGPTKARPGPACRSGSSTSAVGWFTGPSSRSMSDILDRSGR